MDLWGSGVFSRDIPEDFHNNSFDVFLDGNMFIVAWSQF
jgi:hypothetical protein